MRCGPCGAHDHEVCPRLPGEDAMRESLVRSLRLLGVTVGSATPGGQVSIADLLLTLERAAESRHMETWHETCRCLLCQAKRERKAGGKGPVVIG